MEAEKNVSDEGKVKSYAGIPEAEFVDDIDAYMVLENNNGEVDKVLKRLDEQHSKYKCMEYNLLSKKRRLRVQIPDLEMSLAMIKFLQKQNSELPSDLEMEFLLSEQAYVKAKIPPPTGCVSGWATVTWSCWQANVMLEYTLEDAADLLEKNIDSAKKNLSHVEHDLDFLRDQFTTTEVNMARVFNWDVKRRKSAKEAAS